MCFVPHQTIYIDLGTSHTKSVKEIVFFQSTDGFEVPWTFWSSDRTFDHVIWLRGWPLIKNCIIYASLGLWHWRPETTFCGGPFPNSRCTDLLFRYVGWFSIHGWILKRIYQFSCLLFITQSNSSRSKFGGSLSLCSHIEPSRTYWSQVSSYCLLIKNLRTMCTRTP